MENENKNHPSYCRALDMIKKGTQNDVNEIPGNVSIVETQKIVLNGTA